MSTPMKALIQERLKAKIVRVINPEDPTNDDDCYEDSSCDDEKPVGRGGKRKVEGNVSEDILHMLMQQRKNEVFDILHRDVDSTGDKIFQESLEAVHRSSYRNSPLCPSPVNVSIQLSPENDYDDALSTTEESHSLQARFAAQAFVEKREKRGAKCTPRTWAARRWLQSLDSTDQYSLQYRRCS